MLDLHTKNAVLIEDIGKAGEEGFNLSTIPNYLTATGFDIASSIWNTFAPSDYEVTTSELLYDAGLDTVEKFYKDNQWGVELGSLLGGGLITGLGAGAVINALRVGKLASLPYNPFAKMSNYAARNREKTLELIKNGAENTADYKKALRGLRGGLIGGSVAEGITQEAAFLALMQEHPWMEDYGVETFMLGAALFNLGLPLKYASESKKIFDMGRQLQNDQLRNIDLPSVLHTESFQGVDDAMDVIANRLHRIQTQNSVLKSIGPEDGFAIKTLEKNKAMDTAQALRELRSMTQGDLRTKTDQFFSMQNKPLKTSEELDFTDKGGIHDIYDYLMSNPTIASLQGVQALREFKQGSRLGDLTRLGKPVDSGSSAKKFWEDIALMGNLRPGQSISSNYEISQTAALFDPILKKVVPAEEALYSLRASDLYDDVVGLSKIPKIVDNAGTLSTHAEDLRYLQAYKGIDKSYDGSQVIKHNDLRNLDAIAHMQKPPVAVSIQNADGAITTIQYADLKQHIKNYKKGEVNRLDKEGYFDEQISVYLNMPSESVIMTKLGRDTDNFWHYNKTGGDYVDRMLNKKKVLLDGDDLASANAINVRPATILDAETMRNIHGARAGSQFAHPDTPVEMKKLYGDLLSSKEITELDTHVNDFLSRIGAGSRLISSADFALRSLGKLGEYATAFGGALKNSTDNLVSTQIKKVAPLVQLVREDKTQSVIMGQFLNRYHQHTRKELNASRYNPQSGKIILKEATDDEVEVVMKWDNGDEIVIPHSSPTGRLIDEYQKGPNATMQGISNLNRRLNNPDVTPYTGLHFPYMPLRDKHVGYIYNRDDPSKSRIFYAKSPADLNQLAEIAKKSIKGNESVVLKADAEDWLLMHNYASEGNWLQNANPELRKVGIGGVNVSATGDELVDLMESISADIAGNLRGITKKTHPGLFERLNTISTMYANELKSGNKNIKDARKLDYGTVMEATLLNKSLLKDNLFPLATRANEWFEVGANRALNALNNAKIQFTGKGEISPEDFQKLGRDLSSQGVPNPYHTMQDYAAHNLPQWKDLSGDVISNSTALMAALNLRLLEAAHAAVTTLTIPITTLSVLKNEKATTPFRHVYNGLKMFFKDDPLTNRIRTRGEEYGFTQMRLVEMMESFGQMHQTNKINKVLNSQLMKYLTKPSDWSEHFSRQIAYYSGMSLALERDALAANRLMRNTGLDSTEAFADSFTKRTMGNYISSQRPVMFQGQLGHMMSVYQTFMLTMLQNAFKFMEERDLKAMLTAVGAQTTMFGTGSLPGFEYLNSQIGAHLLQDNQDIKSTAYRLFGNTSGDSVNLAETLLYGVPSAIFNQGLSSRGNLDPRLPFSINTEGVSGLPPVISMAIQTLQAGANAGNLIAGTLQAGGSAMDYGKAMNQAVAMQSISRPLRGIAELFQGYTTDNKGEVIADNSLEELSNLGRAVGLRPLKEHVLRNTRYTSRYYDAMDYSNRQKAISSVRRLMAGDTDLDINLILGQYLDTGGTISGWQSVVNRAYKEANVSMATRLENEIKRSPMMDYILDAYTL